MDKISTYKKIGKRYKKNSILKFYSKGKHSKIKKNNSTKTNNVLVYVTAMLLVCFITGTSAYIHLKNSINNVFVIGDVKPVIIEDFDIENKTKTDVFIKNEGNIPIYLRAAIIINWKDEKGQIIDVNPEENIDYVIELSTSQNWIKAKDGYYYYKIALDENNNTDILIEECTQKKEYENYILEVSIAVQAIQANPSNAVSEAWNVEIIDNMLALKE